ARPSGPPASSPSAPPSGARPNPTHDAIRQKWEELAQRRANVDVYERETIEEALTVCDGTIARAARLLSVPRTGLISRMAKLQIDPEQFKGR
ncbi:MAG: helix-turn-helix domain-containing protein, partial [Myxococcota bacterium]